MLTLFASRLFISPLDCLLSSHFFCLTLFLCFSLDDVTNGLFAWCSVPLGEDECYKTKLSMGNSRLEKIAMDLGFKFLS